MALDNGQDKPSWMTLHEDGFGVNISGTDYRFRDPDLWTIGEVYEIEDACIVFEGGMPKASMSVKVAKTLAKAVEGMTEKKAESLPFYVGNVLFALARWKAIPLSASLISTSSAPGDQ